MIKSYLLDDDNNIVDEEKATHFISQELDEKGNLIGETHGMLNVSYNKMQENMKVGEPSPEIKKVFDDYVDENGNHPFRKQ